MILKDSDFEEQLQMFLCDLVTLSIAKYNRVSPEHCVNVCCVQFPYFLFCLAESFGTLVQYSILVHLRQGDVVDGTVRS